MNRKAINYQVKREIEHWLYLQENAMINVKITEGAFDLLCQIIENIETDKSAIWILDDRNNNYKSTQEYAISLIPKALNEIYPFRDISYKRFIEYIKRVRDSEYIKISSWEILHSMTKILNRFCFIPKEDF